MEYLNKNKKHLSLVLLSVLFGFFIPLHFASAAWWNIGTNLFNAILAALIYIVGVCLGVVAMIFDMLSRFASVILEEVMKKFVLNLSDWLDFTKMPIIGASWIIVRNLANTIFIFALLYEAIMTIFGSGSKQVIANILITAMLVNFSAAITNVAIDVSNVLTVGIYKKIMLIPASAGPFGDTFAGRLTSNIDPKNVANPENLVNAMCDTPPCPGQDLNARLKAEAESSSASKALEEEGQSDIVAKASSVFLQNLFEIVFYIILIYILFYMAIIFVGRYIVFLFLIIFSPLAIASYTVPGLKSKIYNTWEKHLKEQCFIAPALMFFLYITGSIIGSFSGLNSPKTILIRFMIVIGMLLGSLKAAKEVGGAMGDMASKGAGGATGAAIGATAKVGRQTAGRTATVLSETKIGKKVGARFAAMEEKRGSGYFGTPAAYITRGVGRLGTQSLNTVKDSSYDIRNSKSFGKVSGELGSYGVKIDKDVLNKNKGFATLEKEKQDETTKKTAANLKTIKKTDEELYKKTKSMLETQSKIDSPLLINAVTRRSADNKAVEQSLKDMKKTEREDNTKKREEESAKKFEEILTNLGRAVKEGDKNINIAQEVGKIKPKQIANIPEEIIIKPEVSIHLDKSQLTEFGRSATRESKDKVKSNILKEAKLAGFTPSSEEKKPTLNKSAEWLSGPKGSEIF
jgi:hypothetical protein